MKNRIAMIYIDDMQIIGRVVQPENGLALKNLGTVQREYSGIMEGDFADREDFTATLTAVVNDLAAEVGRLPETLYIGVPNPLCRVETDETELEFDRLTKINRQHLDLLWSDTNFNEENREIIAKRALCFKLAEYEDVLLDVLGMATTSLQMISCAISVSAEFRPLIDTVELGQLGISNIELLNIAESELFMIPEKYRDVGCSLVRCDFFSTSITNVLGDGVTQMSYFDYGAGHIVNEIVDSFSVSYDVAMQMLAQCSPTFNMLLGESYTVDGQELPAGIFNDFVNKLLNKFADRLASVELARTVFLSGGNLDQIYGVKNILANACNRRMYFCVDNLTQQTDYPDNTLNAMARLILRNL